MEHEDQITLRLPKDLSRAIARQAKERHVPKAHLVREALAMYLGQGPAQLPDQVRERMEHFVGAVSYDTRRPGTDAVAARIYRHNVRE